jgi:ABC-type uncharacterized transport system permease subunit
VSTNITAKADGEGTGAGSRGAAGANGKGDGNGTRAGGGNGATAGRKPGGARRKLSYPVVLLIIAGGLVALSLLRVVTGADEVTSSGQYSSALAAAVPIGLAGLGGLWSERAGVINIGLEGMMMLGTFAAGWMGWQHGPWVAALAGIVGGALGGLIHAIATVTFGVDHIVSGVAVNILALGVVQFLAKLWF